MFSLGRRISGLFVRRTYDCVTAIRRFLNKGREQHVDYKKTLTRPRSLSTAVNPATFSRHRNSRLATAIVPN